MSETLFLSAVSGEFGELRQRLADLLLRTCHVHVRHQDSFAHRGVTTLQMLEEEILLSDVVVHIIGASEGWCPPLEQVGDFLNRNPNFESSLPEVSQIARMGIISATQWEAWIGIYHHRRVYAYELPTRLVAGSSQQLHSERLHNSHNHPKRVERDERLFDEILLSLIERGLLTKDQANNYSSALLNQYLTDLAEAFQWLYLQGINEANRNTLRIELEKVYVALKAEPWTDEDRQQEAELYDIETHEAAQRRLRFTDQGAINTNLLDECEAEVIRATYHPRRDEARRLEIEEVRTVADAFRQHHRLVILGGPGSGKTTLGRWLALQMARSVLQELNSGVPVNVEVPLSQVDPDPDALQHRDAKVNLGPARIPIFLRIAHYSRELAQRDEVTPLPLIKYLGHDRDCANLGNGSPEARNALFRSLIAAKRAVIILDGLDELPESNRRLVVNAIEDFVKNHIPRNDQAETSPPCKSGGNQVIITSRYVGYKTGPIRAGCIHFGIQTMRRGAVEWFIRSWASAVNAILAAEGKWGLDAKELIDEIYDETRPSIRELATNPLLITILAAVYLQDRKLPDQRAAVYDRVVENAIAIWLQRKECKDQELTREQLLAALQPLAEWMQGNVNSNGLVSLSRIEELVEGPLANMRGMLPDDPRFPPVLQAILDTISQHVGLLAEQGPKNYAFFHRSFQEFLAARRLITSSHPAHEIRQRLDDPLWREPLLLALGFAMLGKEGWGPTKRNRLLSDVLAADLSGTIIPRAVLLIVTAIPDLPPPRDKIDHEEQADLLGKMALRLLTSYDISLTQTQAGSLREQIEQAFAQLRDGRHSSTVAGQIASTICRWQPTERDLAPAVAVLLRRIEWFTTSLVDALMQSIPRDRPERGWPIRWALLAALGHRPAGVPWLAPAYTPEPSTLQRLPMRQLLERKPALVAFVLDNPDWLWLLIALYGGLGHVQLLERLNRRQSHRVRMIQNLPAIHPLDDAERLAVDRLAFDSLIQFSPLDIVHDLADKELSRIVQQRLNAKRPAHELLKELEVRWNQGSNPSACAEALIGLAALGDDIHPRLCQAMADEERRPFVLAALARFDWLGLHMREPLARTTDVLLRTIPDDIPEERQLDLLGIAISLLMESGRPPILVGRHLPEYRYIQSNSPTVQAVLDAEFWMYLYSGVADDRFSAKGSAISAIDGLMRLSGECLIDSLGLLHKAQNCQAAHRLAWPLLPMPPRIDTAVDRYLAMLDNLAYLPDEFLPQAGYIIRRSGSILDRHPDLWWETLALMWSRGDAIWAGYRIAPLQLRLNAEVIRDLTTAGVPAEIQEKLELLRHCEFKTHDQFTGSVIELIGQDAWRNFGEAILACVANHWRTFNDLEWNSRTDFLHHVAAITDPYLRFRAEWRYRFYVIHTTPTLDSSNLSRANTEAGINVPHSAISLVGMYGIQRPLQRLLSLAEGIDSPGQLLTALEWILVTIPVLFPILQPKLAMVASNISDPENRARAQCRMAIFNPEASEQHLQYALESMRAISDPARKAETIQEARILWAWLSESQQPLDEVAHMIVDDWLRAKALGRCSRLVQEYRQKYNIGALAWRTDEQTHRHRVPTGTLAWGLAYMSTTAAEIRALGNMVSAGDDRLALCLGGAEIATGQENGIPVTARNVAILDRELQNGRAMTLDNLWPFLEHPTPETQTTIQRWLARSDLAGQWAALVQAEAGNLSPEIVARIIDLLVESTDRLHLRAALALHGTTSYTGNKNRRWSIQKVGATAVETIARRVSEFDCPPSLRSSLQWVHHDIHHDDPAALRNWLAEAAGDSQEAEPARWIIRNTESMRADLLPLLFESLRTPALQIPILFGIARLAHCSGLTPDVATLAYDAIVAIPEEVRLQVCSLRRGPVAVMEIAQQVIEKPEPTRIAYARKLLELEQQWLDDNCLQSTTKFLVRLRAIGNQLYITLNSYWADANQKASELTEYDAIMRFLLAWLEAEYNDTDPNLPHPTRILPHILTATEAMANRAPLAFAKLADPPEKWESILADLVQTEPHWAGRTAAIRLLGRLRRVTVTVVDALKSAMHDVSFVHQGAFEAAADFRLMEKGILPALLDLLDSPSTTVIAAATKLLVGVARAECNPEDRRIILKKLEEVVTLPSASRPVHLMEETSDKMEIRFVGRLDRLLYQAIVDINPL